MKKVLPLLLFFLILIFYANQILGIMIYDIE